MIVNKWIVNSVRAILSMHSILHIIEAIAAALEGAWITFTIVIIAGLAQVLAAYLLPNEHIHLRNPVISKIHKH